eukprot:Gregarina_sp_Poly_1__6688@NODE_35_length_18769_cov_73_980644_g30_i0_p12_GENE_NODE_35_length_18769_cov_73_980644_g30_i0NODE_35_length_18769_cov_73_980644_g30_i0_p12_ORF_typecomplete_len193_score19_16Rhomboid/PF01694_22/4_8e02Rhomboid/PF01694_22/8_2e05_NODE_35_length_18769_cov_73_980644_g30_i028953473
MIQKTVKQVCAAQVQSSMDTVLEWSLLPPERLGPLPFGADDFWGIYDERPPKFVEYGMRHLIVFWVVIYAIQVFASSLLVGDLVFTSIPRVAVTMGCLYRHIDPWYMMIPRWTTCTYLHYNPMHIFMNCFGVIASLIVFQRGAGRVGNTAWLWYYMFPLWYSGAITGSFMSYTAKLGRSGSFSVGASGGGYA